MPRLSNRTEIRRLLSLDRPWAVYALGDLAPGFFEHCEWHYAPRDAPGLALIYRAFETPVLFTLGPREAVRAILDEIADEPRLYLSVRSEHLPVIRARYRIEDEEAMWRMSLDPARLPRPSPNPAVRLGLSDLPALGRLYADGDGTGESPGFFTPEMVERGLFFGLREGSGLASAAGTHVLSAEESVAAIGNVYTRRDRRGRGLAQQVTAALVAQLLSEGFSTIALNVAQANAAALRVYGRLGFSPYCPFWEGTATLYPESGDDR
jgi:ribosomal protein S18 acetylase RimI-like enzyme